jgi:hypothetical protein
MYHSGERGPNSETAEPSNGFTGGNEAYLGYIRLSGAGALDLSESQYFTPSTPSGYSYFEETPWLKFKGGRAVPVEILIL